MNRIQYPSARLVIVLLCMVLGLWVKAQPTGNCNTVQVSAQTFESRCTATGTIAISASGGSGQFNYRVTGPINTSYTSSSSISGLTPGLYTVYVQDFVNGCVRQLDSVSIAGNYEDPAFHCLPTISVVKTPPITAASQRLTSLADASSSGSPS